MGWDGTGWGGNASVLLHDHEYNNNNTFDTCTTGFQGCGRKRDGNSRRTNRAHRDLWREVRLRYGRGGRSLVHFETHAVVDLVICERDVVFVCRVPEAGKHRSVG